MLTYKELMTSSRYITQQTLGQNSKENLTIEQRSKAVSVDITSIKKTVRDNKSYLEFNCKGRAITDKQYYDLTILFYVGSTQKKVEGQKILTFEKVTEFAPTWVRCGCPYFLYYTEFVLDSFGSTTIRKSVNNGKPPVVRNPDEIPHVCKHLYRALPLALKTAQNIKT